jgi:hypothetical protein
MPESKPWIWLGASLLWHRASGGIDWSPLPLSTAPVDTDRKQALASPMADAQPVEATSADMSSDMTQLPWEPSFSSPEGHVRPLPDVGRKLGLGIPGNARLERLHTLVLEALADRLQASPILVTPPARAPLLQHLWQQDASLIGGILLEPAMLSSERPTSRAREHDGYIIDWLQPERRIWPPTVFVDRVRGHPCTRAHRIPPPPPYPPLPALISIADFRAARARPLALLAPSAPDTTTHRLQPLTDGRLDIQCETSKLNSRRAGIGLVWAWGFAREMWQPALPPMPLPDQHQEAWRLQLGPGFQWRLQPWHESDSPPSTGVASGELLPPVLGDCAVSTLTGGGPASSDPVRIAPGSSPGIHAGERPPQILGSTNGYAQ